MACLIDPRTIVTTSGACMLPALLLLACTDRPANGDEATASTTDTTSAATTGTTLTTTGDTTDPPTSTNPTSSTEPDPTSTTQPDPSTSTTDTSTTDPVATDSTTTTSTTTTTDTGESTTEPLPAGCNDCDALWEFDGHLIVDPLSDLAALQCLGVVHGQMTVAGDLTAEQLAPLCHLQIVDNDVSIQDNKVLTDLSSFAGLEDAKSLRLWQLPALTVVSLPSLRDVPFIEITETGATTLGSFGPDFTGIQELTITDNPALTDLSGMVGWGLKGGSFQAITIRSSAALTDLSELADLFAIAGDSFSFELRDAPALTSLTGLGTASKGSYEFTDLPLLTTLQPLSQVKTLGALRMRNIPLTSLAGLDSLQSVNLRLDAMPLLTSITGLGSLTTGTVSLWNLPALASIKGLEKFTTGDISFIDLPLVSSLAPLSGLVDTAFFGIQGMPLVTSLTGLDNLESAHSLSIGDCINEGTSGMAGITSLAGLGALTSADEFMVTNSPKLTSLAGVGALSVVSERLSVINNPKLPKAAFDALLVQVDEPMTTCFGDWGACDCIEIMPP